MYFYLDR